MSNPDLLYNDKVKLCNCGSRAPLWYSWEQCPATSHSGGRYYDHARNAHIELSSVEVVGPSSTCQLADLPESRHGHAATRLGDSVVVCGGLSGRHIHERWEHGGLIRQGRADRELSWFWGKMREPGGAHYRSTIWLLSLTPLKTVFLCFFGGEIWIFLPGKKESFWDWAIGEK